MYITHDNKNGCVCRAFNLPLNEREFLTDAIHQDNCAAFYLGRTSPRQVPLPTTPPVQESSSPQSADPHPQEGGLVHLDLAHPEEASSERLEHLVQDADGRAPEDDQQPLVERQRHDAEDLGKERDVTAQEGDVTSGFFGLVCCNYPHCGQGSGG